MQQQQQQQRTRQAGRQAVRAVVASAKTGCQGCLVPVCWVSGSVGLRRAGRSVGRSVGRVCSFGREAKRQSKASNSNLSKEGRKEENKRRCGIDCRLFGARWCRPKGKCRRAGLLNDDYLPLFLAWIDSLTERCPFPFQGRYWELLLALTLI